MATDAVTLPDTPPTEVRVAPGSQVNAGGQILRNGEVVNIRDAEKLDRWLRLGWVIRS